MDFSDARGLRLQREYLQAESRLRRHGVRHAVLVMGSIRASRKTPYYCVARELGHIVGRAGGAIAPSIGLNIDLPRPQLPNRYITPGLSLRFRYFALRKLHFLLRARAMVAFPGGLGTFDELFETLTLVQTRKIRPLPIVLVSEAYWRRAVDMDYLLSAGMIRAADSKLFSYAESARDTWTTIRRWYRKAGVPVFPAE